MKTKKPQDANPDSSQTCSLIPLEMGAFKAALQDLIATPRDGIAEASTKLMLTSAGNKAWCEVTEAKAKIEIDGGKTESAIPNYRQALAAVNARRKLVTVLEDLFPFIMEWNRADSAAISAHERAIQLAAAAAPLRMEADSLIARDMRLDPTGQLPNVESLHDETRLIERVLTDGRWRKTSMDFRESAMAEELTELVKTRGYKWLPTKEGAEGRVKELGIQIPELDMQLENSLDAREISRLKELNCAIEARQLEIDEAEAAAATLDTAAEAARTSLSLRIEAALIMAGGVIDAHLIITNNSPG